MEYLYILIAGFGGGIVRGLIGYIKYQYSYKNVGFELPYFFVMVFISGVIGTLVAGAVSGVEGLLIGISPAIAFIAGYAGGDLIENIYKILIKKWM